MTTLLPPHPHLGHLKKQAKELLHGQRRGTADVCDRLRLLHRFVQASEKAILSAELSLSEAQHALALSYGFRNWTLLREHVESLRVSGLAGLLRGTGPDPVRAALEVEDSVWAIDIGARTVKVAGFEVPAREGTRLAWCAHREYSHLLSRLSRTEAVTQVLGDLLSASDFSARTCMVSLSGQVCYCRFVALPADVRTLKQVDELVENGLRQNLHFARDEVVCDTHVFTGTDRRREAMSVVVKKAVVQEMQAAATAAGLTCMAMDMAPAACRNGARVTGLGASELGLVFNLGERTTTLLFMSEAHFFLRIIPIAGQQMTEAIARATGTGLAEAEQRKRQASGTAAVVTDAAMAASVDVVLTQICSEVERSLQVYREHQHDERTPRVYLTGGGSLMPGIQSVIAEKLGLAVELWNPFAGVPVSPSVDAAQLRAEAAFAGEVVGLGMRYHTPDAVLLSFLPPDEVV